MSRDLWYGTSGPKDASIVLVGESWGVEELQSQRPFVGSSGVELNRMLPEAGLSREQILCTNVVAEKPQGNEMWRLFVPKLTALPSQTETMRGLHPSDLVRAEVSRLYRQIAEYPRKLIIGTGNYALWALSNCSGETVLRASNNRSIAKDDQRAVPNGIMNWRGSMWYYEPYGQPATKIPFLPVVHPAAILRQWDLRTVTVHDLKVRSRLALRDDWRHKEPPVFWAPPTFEQARTKLIEWLHRAYAGETIYLAEDIETAKGLITCIGFADSSYFAMCIPLVRRFETGLVSWWTPDQEAILVGLIRRLHKCPTILIQGQNFIYDTQYIQYWFASRPKLDWDSMLCQNVLFPGTPKGLDYLSSLYCKYHWYWKEDGKEWDGTGTIEDLLVYNCWDNVRTWEVCSVQRGMIEAYGQQSQMRDKMLTNDLCLRMMNRGVAIDMKLRNKLSLELMHAMQELENELGQIIPQEMVSPDNKTPWWRSDTQTRYLYYDRLGFRIKKDRKTGQPSVGKEARMALAKEYPEFGGLFDRLRMYGSAENAYNVINAGLDIDSRLRCAYSATAETHRLQSRKNVFGRGTNLQNLTKGEEDD